MVKHVLVIHLGTNTHTEDAVFMDQSFQLRWIGVNGDMEQARSLIAEYDGRVDAIALDGMPALLELGSESRAHEDGRTLSDIATETPVVDGHGIRAGLERWGVILADRAQPGIFGQKRILMTPGLNHTGLAQALGRRGSALRYADPFVYFSLPAVPGIGTEATLDQAAGPTLDQLRSASFTRLFPSSAAVESHNQDLFKWADVIAGDIGVI
ncbi:MAG: serine carboxypeptidase, partial [Chloroflexota bacterium]